MQVVPIACAGDASVPARAARRRGPRATRARKPLDLSYWEDERLNNKINRVVCSEPWYRHCKNLIQTGAVAYKDDQAKELRRTAVYPPGGVLTRMERCSCCGHWSPACRYTRERDVRALDDGQVDVTYSAWEPICGDCHAGVLPLFDMVRVQSSPGSTTRIKDKDLPAHLEGAGYGRRAKRRRYVGDGGGVLDEVVVGEGDEREVYDLVVVPPEEAIPADAEAVDDAGEFAGNEA